MTDVHRQVTAERARWPWLSLLPLGAGAWAPIYAGFKAHMKTWVALGALWSAVTVAGWVKSSISHSGHDDVAGMLMIVGWVGAIATSFVIRGEYERRTGSPLLEAEARAQQRLSDRQRALEIAAQNPSLAREMGVGRPDRAGALDAGLVDVNNAAVTALLELPGVDGDVATQIVETREQVDGFSSLEDLGATLDLDGDLVEQLRGRVVFLPREARPSPKPSSADHAD
jgi:DNA uptake protein ComE-like DNA-binding protein